MEGGYQNPQHQKLGKQHFVFFFYNTLPASSSLTLLTHMRLRIPTHFFADRGRLFHSSHLCFYPDVVRAKQLSVFLNEN